MAYLPFFISLLWYYFFMELEKEYLALLKEKTLPYIKESENNSLSLLKSNDAYCFMCQKKMDAREIKHYELKNGNDTALCPYCGLPTIVCSSSGLDCSSSALKEVKNDISSHECINFSLLLDTVDAYVDKKIDQSLETENLFLKNLKKLKKYFPERANLLLAFHYHTGGNFGKVNHSLAFKYFSDPSLSTNGIANYYLGSYIDHGYVKKYYMKFDSFVHFSKSAMLGNYAGILEYALSFVVGEYVIPDPNFALGLLRNEFPYLYSDFVKDRSNPGVFSDYCFAFCSILAKNFKNTPVEALLRYILLSMFALDYHDNLGELEHTPLFLKMNKDSKEQFSSSFEDLDMNQNPSFSSSNMTLDLDTFFDSFFDLPSVGKRVFKNINFDEISGVLNFDLVCEYPQLLIDTASFSIGFSPNKTIHFTVDEIEECNLKEDAIFDGLNMEDGGIMSFYEYSDSGKIGNGDIVLKPTLKEIKEKLENEMDFASSISNENKKN